MAVGRAAGLAAAVVAGALLAGCTSGEPDARPAEPTTSASETVSEVADPVTLRFAVFGPKPSLEAYHQLAQAFSATSPHITVEVERAATADDVLELVRDPSGGPDVFLIDQDHLPGLVEDELVQPVDGLLAAREVDFGDGYQRSGLTAFAAQSALQCMPHDVSPAVVYYNKDLVDLESLGTEEEEPPSALDGWRWETFEVAARQAARGQTRGVHLEPSLASLAPFVWSAGGEIVDDLQAPTTLTLSEDDSREALEQVLALARDPQVTPTREEIEEQNAVSRFVDGKLAMIFGTRALTPRLRAAEDLDFDVMPLPSISRFRTVSDMTGYCVSAGTEHLETAGDFLAYAVSRDGASVTARSGYVVPSNLEVANSATFTQPAQPPESSFIFNEGVRRSQSMPFVQEWPALERALAADLDELFYDPVIDLDELLAEIDTMSQEILAPQEG